jgi:hypothetical protein
MPVAALLPLDTWQNFYVIVGTAAATLTGLMFVVITLIAQIQISSSRSHVTVFTTSNVFHFGAVLLAAGILSAPWQALWPAGLLLGLAGLAGVDLHAHRALAGTPPSALSTGALRLAVVYGLAARLLRRPRRCGDCAPESAGTGLIRHRCGNDAAPVHWHPQRMGCGDLHGLRTLRAPG